MKFGMSGSRGGAWQKFQAAFGTHIGKPPIIARPSLNRPSVTRIKETSDFGTNPGNLRMFTYVPGSVDSFLSDSPALVVVLHGCGHGLVQPHDDFGGADEIGHQHRRGLGGHCVRFTSARDSLHVQHEGSP